MPTVILSNFAGAGAQFFDNSGRILSGGKISTYIAGTTTNTTVYTDSSGGIAHTNPIILDSTGRVPSGGEIWLINGSNYKFVLKNSSDVVIGTYDNIFAGLTSNSVTNSIIAANAVTEAKIADGSVTPAKLSTGHPTWTTAGALTVGNNLTVSGTSTLTGNVSTSGTYSGTLASTVTGTTQSVGDNSTKIATTAYVDRISNSVQIQPISTNTISAGGFTVTLAPTTLVFRSPTSTNGTTYTRQVLSSLTLPIVSGATFGYPVSTSSRIAIIAIDNGGTVLLGACSVNNELTETNLISTTILNGSSTSTYTYYASTGGLSGLAYRVVGYIDATYTGAGVWTSIEKVQGAGGNSVVALASGSRYVTLDSTTGSSITFSNIPITAKKITLSFYGVSNSDGASIVVQIGYNSVETTGYLSNSVLSSTGSATGGDGSITNGFVMLTDTDPDELNGHMMLTNIGSNKWVESHVAYTGTGHMGSGGGRKSVTTGVNIVVITRQTGTGSFDGGTIGIMYE